MPEEEKVYTSMYSKNSELYHHGIKGQKWGIRNGPPYPLDSSISTGEKLKRQSVKAGSILDKESRKSRKEKREEKRETTTSKAIKKAKKMTNEELKKEIDRLDLEKKYANVTKDLAELNKKNPTLAKRARDCVKRVLKEQLMKTGKTIVNSVTQEFNEKLSSEIRDAMDKKLQIRNYKPDSPKNEDNNQNDGTNNTSSVSGKEKKPSKIKEAFEEYKKDYKEGWSYNPEPGMTRKERKEAEEVYTEMRRIDARAEQVKTMRDDPRYDQYHEQASRQYEEFSNQSKQYRDANKDILDRYERQKSKKLGSKHLANYNGHDYYIDDIDSANEKANKKKKR